MNSNFHSFDQMSWVTVAPLTSHTIMSLKFYFVMFLLVDFLVLFQGQDRVTATGTNVGQVPTTLPQNPLASLPQQMFSQPPPPLSSTSKPPPHLPYSGFYTQPADRIPHRRASVGNSHISEAYRQRLAKLSLLSPQLSDPNLMLEKGKNTEKYERHTKCLAIC